MAANTDVDSRMQALSVKEPWATLIVRHGKTAENRTWWTGYRGTLVICAAKKPEPGAAEIWAEVMARLYPGLPVPRMSDQIRPGCAVGLMELYDCDQRMETEWDIAGQWHFRLRDPHVFRHPFPVKGQLGLFPVEGDDVHEAW